VKSAKFKDSPLGPIPQDWEVKRLGDLFDFAAAGDLQDNCSSKMPTHENIYPIYSNTVPQKGLYGYTSRPRFKKGCMTITGRGTLGHAEYRDSDFDAIIRLIVMQPHKEVDARFFAAYVNTYSPFPVSVSSIPQLTVPQVQETIAPCPPLPEQRRIAEALGAVDKLIDSLDAQIEKKRRIAQGLAHDLLGMRDGKNEPIRRLPGFKGGWRRVPFSQAFTMLNNNTYSRDFMCAPREGTVMNIHYGDVLIKFACVLDLGVDEVPCLKNGVRPNKDFIQDGDIVIADTAEDETVGRVVEIQGVGESQCVSGLHTVLCRPMTNAFASGFLGYYMNSQSYHDQLMPLITGSKVSALSRSSLAKTELVIPPTIAEQQAIAEVLAAADSEIAGLEAKKRKYEQIKSGMMQDLLTGKVRVNEECGMRNAE